MSELLTYPANPFLLKKKKKKDTENVPREINKVVDDGVWCFHVRE